MTSDQPRDWDRELAAIDKLIAAGPAKPASPVPAAGPRAEPGPAASQSPPARPARASRRDALKTWARAGLAVILGVAMTQWPYPRACGGLLFLYLGAVGMVVVAGLWAVIGAWRRRLGAAHTVGLLVVLWGAALAAGVILPRIGYARQAAAWWCP